MAVDMLALLLAISLHPPGVEVVWRGGAGCDAAPFDASLERHLAHTPTPRPTRVTITTRTDDDGQFVARVVLSGAHGDTTRELRGPSCTEVAEAAAFVTAVTVDPGVLAPHPDLPPGSIRPDSPPGPSGPDSPPASPAPPLELELPVEPGAPPATAPSPALPPPRSNAAVLVRGGGGIEALGMPEVGPLAQLGVGAQGKRWRVELVAHYRAPTRVDAGVPGVGGVIRQWMIGARGCGVLRPGPLDLPLCLGLEAGQALGRGVGFVGAQRGSLPWFAAVVAPILAWAPPGLGTRLALWAGVEVALPLHRGVFAVHGLGDLYPTGPVSLRAALGVEVRIPAARPKDPARPGK